GAPRAFAEAVEERLAAVGVEHVVLAGKEKHRQSGRLQHLLGVIELLLAGELRHVAGVENEIWLDGQRLHLRDRFAEGCASIGVGRLVEPDMAVAKLDKGEGLRRYTPQRCPNGGIQAN